MSKALKKIKELSEDVYKKILRKKQPQLDSPLRSLTNVKYDPKDGYFELLGKMKSRTLTASSVKTFAQTLRMMSLSKSLITSDDIATKREAYYVSKNWGDARFKEQPESDTVMDDIEAMTMVNREQIGFIPEEKGGAVAGKLTVVDQDPETRWLPCERTPCAYRCLPSLSLDPTRIYTAMVTSGSIILQIARSHRISEEPVDIVLSAGGGTAGLAQSQRQRMRLRP